MRTKSLASLREQLERIYDMPGLTMKRQKAIYKSFLRYVANIARYNGVELPNGANATISIAITIAAVKAGKSTWCFSDLPAANKELEKGYTKEIYAA